MQIFVCLIPAWVKTVEKMSWKNYQKEKVMVLRKYYFNEEINLRYSILIKITSKKGDYIKSKE